MNLDFPLLLQKKKNDCGITCLEMISKYYNKKININYQIRRKISSEKKLSLYEIKTIAIESGYEAIAVKTTFENLIDLPLPAILHWRNKHYVVIYHIKKDKVYIADPAIGIQHININQLLNSWLDKRYDDLTLGVVLLLKPVVHKHIGEEDG